MAYGHINVPGLSGIDAEQLKALINEKAPGADITRLEELINGKAPGTDITRLEEMINSKESGKRFARLVVGTSTAGWTAADCDYLCDGTDDNVEIQAAIDALPTTGGTVIILDGNYNLTKGLSIKKNNMTLTGQGCLHAGESCGWMINLADYYTHHTVSNLTLYCKGTAFGIHSRGSRATIFGNRIYDTQQGIDAQDGFITNNFIGKTNALKDVVYPRNAFGINGYSSLVVIGNTINGPVTENPEYYNQSIGISLAGGSVCIGNDISYSLTGIRPCGDSLIIGNQLSCNTVGVSLTGPAEWYANNIVMGNYIGSSPSVNSPKHAVLLESAANHNCVMFNFYRQEYPITDESDATYENWIANNWAYVVG